MQLKVEEMNGEELKPFIEYWKGLKFDAWNENDIREDFIAPLLKFLGYAKDTVNSIIREQYCTLNEAYHRIGRDKIKIDYIPTVKLKKFWIIEAKPGTSKVMTLDDFLQAHLYAIHPEIQAKFIVLTNGYEIRVYDAHTSEGWETPILLCEQRTCEQTFAQLYALLSAKTMLLSLRTHILSTIKESLQVEIDERVVDSLQKSFNTMILKSRSIVKKNALNYQREVFHSAREEERKEIEQCDLSTLLRFMNHPGNAMPIYGREICRRCLAVAPSEQQIIVDKLAVTYRGRPHSIFRVHCVDVLTRLILANVHIPQTECEQTLIDKLEELVRSNLNYWAFNDLSNALVHLDNTTLRLAKKLSLRFMMKPLTQLVEKKQQILAAEDLLKNQPTVAKEMIPAMCFLAEYLWEMYCHASDTTKVWNGIWTLEAIEKIIDTIPAPKYPDGDADLLYFEHYGRGFDMLCIGTWDVLKMFASALDKRQIPEFVKTVTSKTREQVIAEIPKSRPMPENWIPTDRDLIAAFGGFSKK